jgi:hypothetical protein
MRNIDMTFLNTIAPAGLVGYDVAPADTVMFYHTPYAIYVNVPANATLADSPTKDLLDRITALKTTYSKAWLPDSVAPTDVAFQNARDFVTTLPLSYIAKPDIQVASDGEVNFHWAGADYHIDLGFYGNGKFSYHGAKVGGPPILGDDVSVKEGAPKSLLDLASVA